MRRFGITAVLCGALLLLPAAADPACEQRTFEQSVFLVCSYDAERDTIALALADHMGAPLRSFRNLSNEIGNHIRFAMNAGMFEKNGWPVGLYVQDARTQVPLNTSRGSGNFYLEPNGVFAVYNDGSVAAESRDAFVKDARAVRWATQSGPMLVIDGSLHPKISENGDSRYVRNGVGVRSARLAYFVISKSPVSFGRLARFFRDALGCRDALYLDGAVSSLWWPEMGRQDSHAALGPMVVVRARSP
jgi:uncharacterized protein YigE (DUF2233 family)